MKVRNSKGGIRHDGLVVQCHRCGKYLLHGESAYGTILGRMDKEAYGFRAGESESWERVVCGDCHRVDIEVLEDAPTYEGLKRAFSQSKNQ